MNARTIYLRADFWKELRKDTSIEGLRLLMDVYDAVSVSTLHSDIEDEMWGSDEYLRLIMKCWSSGKIQIIRHVTLQVDSPMDDAVSLSAIYLAEENTMSCDGLGAQYGVEVLNNKSLIHNQPFRGDGIMLEKRDMYSERYCYFKDKISYPCNAMLLIDPYLLSRSENMKSNVKSLLDALLPTKSLKCCFYISVFSTLGVQDVQSVYDELRRVIERLRNGLKFDLTLYAIGKGEDFHSRMIITNNVLISAEDGFDVFKDNGQANKNAKFDIVLPRLVGDSRKDMSNYLRWIRIAKNYSNRCSEVNYRGSRENRLFDLVD